MHYLNLSSIEAAIFEKDAWSLEETHRVVQSQANVTQPNHRVVKPQTNKS